MHQWDLQLLMDAPREQVTVTKPLGAVLEEIGGRVFFAELAEQVH
jgi:hypothetical protein